MKRTIVILTVFFAVIFSYSDKILDKEGKVEIKRRNDSSWKEVDINMDFNRGDSIRTLTFSKVSIKLYDNSIISLEPETLFTRKNRSTYFINGMGSLKARNIRRSVTIIHDKNSMSFEEGEFIISSNSNLLWGISHQGEFWANGPSGKLRVLSNYQTIITPEYGPIEPELSTFNKNELFKKAKLVKLRTKDEEETNQNIDRPGFFVKFKGFEVCNIEAQENSRIYLNKNNLFQNKILISGQIAKSMVKDIKNIMVSIDGGKNYQEAEGVSPFRFLFRPEHKKKYLVKVMAKDRNGSISGQTFYNIELIYIDEDDRSQIERYYTDLTNYIQQEEYSGVMAYIDEVKFRGDLNTLSENIVDFFYDYDYFYFDYSIRNFIRFDNSLEVGVDWEYDITRTNDGNTEKKEALTIFKWSKDKENRWRITDIIDGSLFGINTVN